jgi:DNA helicase-2/ATP-dependent DNA helicase PcrA
MFERTRPERGGPKTVAGEASPVSSNPPADTSPIAPGAWPKGTRIRSPRFGRGVVIGSTGSGEGLTYTVRFETGEKRILARFGALEREGD